MEKEVEDTLCHVCCYVTWYYCVDADSRGTQLSSEGSCEAFLLLVSWVKKMVVKKNR